MNIIQKAIKWTVGAGIAAGLAALTVSSHGALVVSNNTASATATSVTFYVTLVSTNAGLPAGVVIHYGPADGGSAASAWYGSIDLGNTLTSGTISTQTVYGLTASKPVLQRVHAYDTSNSVWTVLLTSRTTDPSRTDVNSGAVTVTNAANLTATAAVLTTSGTTITWNVGNTTNTTFVITNASIAAVAAVTNAQGSTTSVLKNTGR